MPLARLLRRLVFLSATGILVASAVHALALNAAFAQSDVASALQSSDWPQFLGPTRNGLSSETGLLDAWPANGLKEVWRAKGGVGSASGS